MSNATNAAKERINRQADKQDALYSKVPDIKVGDYVQIATYTKSGDNIYPIILKNISNPLSLKVDGVKKKSRQWKQKSVTIH